MKDLLLRVASLKDAEGKLRYPGVWIPCPRAAIYHRTDITGAEPCDRCHGNPLGVPSQDMSVWLRVAVRKWKVTFNGMGEYVRCLLESAGYTPFGNHKSEGTDEFETLVLALEAAAEAKP